MPKKQIINPYIRFGRTAQGPYAQRLNGGSYARAISQAAGPCFFIISAVAGETAPNQVVICFNKPYSFQRCIIDVPNSFTITTEELDPRVGFGWADAGPSCFIMTLPNTGGEKPTYPSNFDTQTVVYVPGVCSSDDDSECLLPEYTGYPVDNRIYGPSLVRVGDISDTVVVVIFDVAPAVVGNDWRVVMNGTVENPITGTAINGNTIELTVTNPIGAADVVTIDHRSLTGCQSVDGRFCYQFYDKPVANVLASNFWIREDLGQWRREDLTGRWQLET